MNKIPKYLQHLFWDIDTDSFDPVEYPQYTIVRVLEFGNERSIEWLRKTFEEAQIKSVIKMGRQLTSKSANFWALIFGISRDEILSLKKLERIPR